MTQGLVLDASAAIACVAPDESPSQVLVNAVKNGPLIVPALWTFEVYNVLWMLRRKSRITENDLLMALELLAGLTLTIDPPSVARVRTDTLALARAHALTVYDAAYLELARRCGLHLATLDADLRAAARKEKVKLI